MFKNLKIGARFALSTGLIVVVAVAATTVASWLVSRDVSEEALSRELRSARDAMLAELASEAERARSMADLVARMPVAGAAMAARDRAPLEAAFLPTFDAMKADHGVRQFQFHLPPATSFYRVHKPEKFDDDLSGFRRTVLAVNADGKPVHGLEVGVAGLGMRGVVPVHHQGRQVGSVEFGLAFDATFLERFTEHTGVRTALYLARDDGPELFGSTLPEGATIAPAVLEAAMNGDQVRQTETLNGTTYAVLVVPVPDFSGATIGAAVLAIDRAFYTGTEAHARNVMIIVGLAVLVLAVLLAWLLGRGIGAPLVRMSGTMERLAKGDTDLEIPGGDRGDEIADMARAVEVFRQQAIQVHASAGREERLRERNDWERRRGLLDVLHATVDSGVRANQAMIQLAHMRQSVSDADGQAQAMAAAVEELVTSINEISTNTEAVTEDATHAESAASDGVSSSGQAVETMSQIVSAVDQAAGEVNALAEESGQIGAIVGEIEDIAEQTNLLALNATIEAARAGEAGKGFAVVANEVKSLANQTARATEDIRGRIDSLRNRMSGIVDSMQRGSEAVNDGREVIDALGGQLGAIADGVRQVTGKMAEVSGILSQQSAASGEVSRGTSQIAQLSTTNTKGIDSIHDAMDQLTNLLSEQIGHFANLGMDRAIVEIARNDHLVFSKRIVDVISGRGDLKPDQLPDHHLCRLGKWYDAVENPVIRNSGPYQRLLAPHRKVHEVGKAALAAYHAQDRDAALAHLAELEAASGQVVSLLTELADELKRHEEENAPAVD